MKTLEQTARELLLIENDITSSWKNHTSSLTTGPGAAGLSRVVERDEKGKVYRISDYHHANGVKFAQQHHNKNVKTYGMKEHKETN